MINNEVCASTKSTKAPRVSIGMPVYNGEKFICEAIDSLLAQTFKDFELIISDNASTDATEDICREYAIRDRRIRYVRQEVNRGAVLNFQFVLTAAIGEYFMWAAADDVWDKNWISVLYPISRVHHCLAYGMLQTIDGKGCRIRHPAVNRRFDFTGSVLIRRLKYFVQPSFLGKANPIYGVFPIKIFTHQVFDVFGLNTSGADMLALYSLLEVIEIRGGESVFLYKRIHSDCSGGGTESLKTDVFNRVSRFLLRTIIGQYRRIIDYGSLSRIGERIVQLTLIPVLFVFDLLYLVFNKIRFYRK